MFKGYKLKKEPLITKLTKKYEPVFLKFINKEELSSEEKEFFHKGLLDVKDYVVGSIIKAMEGATGFSSMEKKMVVLSKIFLSQRDSGDSLLQVIVEDITISELYLALGIDKNLQKDSKKIFKKQKEEGSYFIKYVKSRVFFSVLSYLEKDIKSSLSSKQNLDSVFNEESITTDIEFKNEIKDVFEKTRLSKALPEDVLLGFEKAIQTREQLSLFSEHLEYILNQKRKIGTD